MSDIIFKLILADICPCILAFERHLLQMFPDLTFVRRFRTLPLFFPVSGSYLCTPFSYIAFVLLCFQILPLSTVSGPCLLFSAVSDPYLRPLPERIQLVESLLLHLLQDLIFIPRFRSYHCALFPDLTFVLCFQTLPSFPVSGSYHCALFLDLTFLRCFQTLSSFRVSGPCLRALFSDRNLCALFPDLIFIPCFWTLASCALF